ncbi:MAG: transposase, partial [Bdellovibrionales bacterium]|nr:transposase [Bdellovibrionales bacterium]
MERLWRSVKYMRRCPKAYDTLDQAYPGLEDYFKFYNDQRPHQALNNRTPAEGVCRQANPVAMRRR